MVMLNMKIRYRDEFYDKAELLKTEKSIDKKYQICCLSQIFRYKWIIPLIS